MYEDDTLGMLQLMCKPRPQRHFVSTQPSGTLTARSRLAHLGRTTEPAMARCWSDPPV